MRYLLPLLALVTVMAVVAGIKWAQISTLIAADAAAKEAGPPPEAVSTDKSRRMEWERALTAVGSVTAARGVAVSNDLPGLVTRIHFESGQVVKKGEVLVELDTSVERAQLATAQAQRDLAERNVGRTRALAARGGVARSQLDADEAELKSARAEVEAIKAQIQRKVVRAPFAGKLGIRMVNLGQYLSPGTTLTTLETLDTVFVDFSLPQQTLPQVTQGLPVRVSVEEGAEVVAQGEVTAVDPRIDETTRSIQVRASVPNHEQKLRPGMFANVHVLLPEQASLVVVPLPSVVRAPYGDSVYVVEDLKDETVPQGAYNGLPVKQVRQQFVRLGQERGDFVAVLDGLDADEEIVTAGAFKLYNGARIVIDNRVKPEPQLNPEPQNR